uniref:mTERF family protein n=1 Tax=Oryza glaberrima TaxID=4538 RepID=I1Q0U2_ORYGL
WSTTSGRNMISLLLQPAYRHPTAAISPLSSLRRLLLFSTTAAPVSPEPFAVEDYLVATWGLTGAQAHKASKKLSHLRSPSKPDAVLAFLSDLGLPPRKIAAVAAADPRFLCADVESNLARRVDELGSLGLSRSQIARLVPLALTCFRSSSVGTNLGFWLQIVGSFDKILKALRMNSSLLGSDLEKMVKPNLELLKQCGMSDVASFPLNTSRLFTANPNYLRDAVARVEELGLDRSSRMFRHGLIAVALTSKESVARKIQLMEELGFSRDELLMIIRKAPQLVASSEEKIRQAAEFLKRDVGLEGWYIAHRPVLFLYSLERRLLPRHHLLKVLRMKGLLDCELDYYNTAAMSERKFVRKFVDPYKCHIPGLADAYTSSCAGETANGVASLLGV